MIYEMKLDQIDMKYFKKAIKVFEDKIDEVIISKKYNKVILLTDVFFNFDLFKLLIEKKD